MSGCFTFAPAEKAVREREREGKGKCDASMRHKKIPKRERQGVQFLSLFLLLPKYRKGPLGSLTNKKTNENWLETSDPCKEVTSLGVTFEGGHLSLRQCLRAEKARFSAK
jgi:hypothetical protein